MNNLQTIQHGNLILTQVKKPLLAVLENQKQLRDYSETEINVALANLTIHLLDLLAVNTGKIDHQIKLNEFIKASNFNLTIGEIKHAFNLFVQGEFNTKPMQQLNAIVFGNVIREYKAYKIENLKAYRRKKREQEEIRAIPSKHDQEKMLDEAIVNTYLEYKSTGTLTGVVSHIYDYLFKQGKLPQHTKEFKAMIFKKAQTIAKSEQMTQASMSMELHKHLKNILAKIGAGKFDGLKTISKRLVLIEYFKNQI